MKKEPGLRAASGPAKLRLRRPVLLTKQAPRIRADETSRRVFFGRRSEGISFSSLRVERARFRTSRRLSSLGRRLLVEVQVKVVGKAGECDLVVARSIEAKLAQAAISARLRPAIEDPPTVTVPDLVDDLRGANADVEGAETSLLAFIGNYDLVGFLPVANHSAVEVIVVHLEEHIVSGVGVVEHPLQEVTLGKHRGKSEGARGRNDSVKDEVASFANERISLMLPGVWIIPLRHTARGERQIQGLGLAGDDFEGGRAGEHLGGSRGNRVSTGGKIERDTAAYSCRKVTCFHDCNIGVGGGEGNFQFAGSGFQRGIRSRDRYGFARNEVFLELPGLEPLFAQFDGMVPGIDGGDGERAIGLNGTDGSLIDENSGSRGATLDGQRGQERLGLLGLEVENKPGLSPLANADLLLGGILKAAFRDLYNVVLELEIR